jgi:hypothetical protein
MLAALVATTARVQGVLGLPTWVPWPGRGRHLRRSTYASYLGTTFRLREQGGGSLRVRLDEIGDLTRSSGAEERFALLFSGPRRAGFQQDQRHIVRHASLGRFRLAVFPVGKPDGKRQHYEAIVNR